MQFLGSLPNHVIQEQLRDADIFVLPSVTAADGDMEGIPVAIMEAMASGAAVASTFHSGIPELIEHQVSGLLSPERDHEMLATNLAQLIKDHDLRKRICTSARAKIESKFDNAVLNRRLKEIIEDQRSITLKDQMI